MTDDSKAEIKALTEQLENMRLAFNQNHALYVETLSILDGHASVIRAVVNDLYTQQVVTVPQDTANPESAKTIDWDQYYSWYTDYRKTQEQEQEADKKEPSDRISQVEMFGGSDVSRTG